MPKVQTRKSTQRAAPYDLRSHNDMATQLLVSPHYQPQYQEWDHSPYEQTQMMPSFPTYMPQMSLQPPLQSHNHIPTQTQEQSTRQPPRHSTSAPWSEGEDRILLDAKRRNMQWDAICAKFFPNKSANACRKRHERIESKRRATDWDEERMARTAVAYKEMRRELWIPLARKLGEKWEHVEKICMAEGYKPLLNRAAHHRRQVSTGSSVNTSALDEDSSPLDEYAEAGAYQRLAPHHEHDDSGIALGMDTRRNSRRLSNDVGVGLDQEGLQGIMPPYREEDYRGGDYGEEVERLR